MSKSGNSTATRGGVGFLGLLTIAFIVLRLTGVIDCPWLLVLAPSILGACLVVFVLLVVVVMLILAELID